MFAHDQRNRDTFNVTMLSSPAQARSPRVGRDLLDSVSLYLHIPFCQRKCPYCDFNTYAGMLDQREAYVAALRDEILLAGERVRMPDGSARRCRTIFLGGGTPSLLTAEQVDMLLGAARRAFAVDDGAEVSLEANPGALEYGRLTELRAAGVNRLSMGAQSFDAGLLHWLGRIHTPDEIATAFGKARAAGFESVNLDFMYAIPKQTMEIWEATLDRALALRPDHLSLYSLIVEEGTPLFRWVEEGRVKPTDEDLAADMYERAAARLATAGYHHYEISNWARAGLECDHNLTYWHNLPYIGLGAGAHGWFAGQRYVEAKPIREYIDRVRQSVAGHAETTFLVGAVIESETISRALEMSETAILGLRLAEGVHRGDFALRFGRDFEMEFGSRLEETRSAGLVEESGEWVRLTERGRLLGNEVFERLLPDENLPSQP
jgi:oxygen-independent coproporphyrinogen-3 oxidase